jgi:predicted lysophospholipase L1 biosynthesis ABC-type transport system permease subunit
MQILTDQSSLDGLQLEPEPQQYSIRLTPGTNLADYVAGLSVLNLVVLDTRQRVHDLGVFKALGMSPGQTIIMVLTSVAGIGLVGAALPAGWAAKTRAQNALRTE